MLQDCFASFWKVMDFTLFFVLPSSHESHCFCTGGLCVLQVNVVIHFHACNNISISCVSESLTRQR